MKGMRLLTKEDWSHSGKLGSPTNRKYFTPQNCQINSYFHSGAKDRSHLFRVSHANARRTGHFFLGVHAPFKAIIHCQRSARFPQGKAMHWHHYQPFVQFYIHLTCPFYRRVVVLPPCCLQIRFAWFWLVGVLLWPISSVCVLAHTVKLLIGARPGSNNFQTCLRPSCYWRQVLY